MSFSFDAQFGGDGASDASSFASPMSDFQSQADLSMFQQIMTEMQGSQGMPPGFPGADEIFSNSQSGGDSNPLSQLTSMLGGGGSDSSGSNPLSQLTSVLGGGGSDSSSLNPLSKLTSLIGGGGSSSGGANPLSGLLG